MKRNSVVSIIMPVFKSEAYIRDAIFSVENQSYPYIELICINDGTPDQSFKICQELAGQYDNIVLLENDKNRGQEYTRNHGLSKATGEYIFFLDSDDTLSQDCIERLVSVAEGNGSDIVFFTYSKMVDGVEYPIEVKKIPDGEYTLKQFADFLLDEISIGILSCIGNKLYRTSLIRDNNINFEYKYKFNEDGAFALCAMQKTDKIYFLNQPLYKYLIRTAGSTMTSYRPKMFSTIVTARELIKDIYVQNEIWEKESKKIAYYKEMLGLMLNSLMNEEKFGNEKSFRETGKLIRNYKDFDEMCEVLYRTGNLSKIRKLILPLIQKQKWSLVYFLVKIQGIKK